MSHLPKISFAKPPVAADAGVLVVFVDDRLQAGPATRAALEPAAGLIERAAAADRFKGKLGATLDLLAPSGLGAERLLVVGLGASAELKPADLLKLGGIVMGKLPSAAKEATVVVERPSGELSPGEIAEFVLGLTLRAYAFDRYKTKKKDDGEEDEPSRARITLVTADDSAAKKAWRGREPVAAGVVLARDLINEPPNVLTPEEFARRAEALSKLDVDVEVLDPKALKKIGMSALLGVAQGSRNEPRVVVMRWKGAGGEGKPIAFIGKGVTFDSGGISIKPAASMEDMKGDMAGAAAVVGLMHALAARKAKVDVVGVVGLVENMPDGEAQRPGDIVASLSGQTVEIINTDAEGRLVLADVLWYVKNRFKPQAMVDLATLTGAILVALGHEHAGLFGNNDELADKLTAAGQATGEKLWRLPLTGDYDKLIDSKVADMKNTGGRFAGSITAAQFLQRFVDGTPWAHLDIAGTGMGAPASDINKSWGAGWGVRLLDRLIADNYEDR
ncbi:leucyl aminopeptidase [Blastochloris viridis]|uniref:Probable cytosol aminopeptidase n=1 Tax=Blastochloris viridis TaxID=1079 RepID=A0A0H5B7T3_BLAVI|nr:leucyl aminopeptidase [Blastochloris viridis]ALK08479.1 Cytosol aminopeptidase [Blastochloris viridis]BAR98237.1 cytosol aminopeptidase PepA [Blastochloris viridis]CUU41141.1 Cytosol aminopeptidase [Blastochloris viridis]